MAERAVGAAEAGRGHLQPRRAKPGVGDLEALVHLAEDVLRRHAAIVEFEDGVRVAAVAHVAIAVADGEALGALVDEECGDALLAAARRVLLAGRHEGDGEARDVGVADEVLGAVQHPVPALGARVGLHAAKVRPRARFGHGEAVPCLAPDAGREVARALVGRAGEQDVRGARDAGPVQGIVRPAKLAFVEKPAQRIEARAPHLGGHVGGIEARGHRLGLDLADEVGAQMAGAFDLGLVRIEFRFHEGSGRLHDHALFVAQSEVHLALMDRRCRSCHRRQAPGQRSSARPPRRGRRPCRPRPLGPRAA